MSDTIPTNDLPIIEVPPELRGLSDEEILELNPFDPEKRDRFRPSKKEREAKKLAREQAKIRRIAEQYRNRENFSHYASRPMPKISDFSGKVSDASAHRAAAPKKTLFVPGQMKKPAAPNPTSPLSAPKTATPLPPRQSSGRVLVGSFGGAAFGAAKTQIISESELAKKRAAEDAKRQRELERKRSLEMLQQMPAKENSPSALDLNSLFKANSPLGAAPAAALNPDGTPVKRKRGRPRKNPLPESL